MNTLFNSGLAFKKAVIEYQIGDETKQLVVPNKREVSVSSASYGFHIKNDSTGESIKADAAKCLTVNNGTQVHYTHHNSNQESFKIERVENNGIVNVYSTNNKADKIQLVIAKIVGNGQVNCFQKSRTLIGQILKNAVVNQRENSYLLVGDNRGFISALNGLNERLSTIINCNHKSGKVKTDPQGNYDIEIGQHIGKLEINGNTKAVVDNIEKDSTIIADGLSANAEVLCFGVGAHPNNCNLEFKNGANLQTTEVAKRLKNQQ